MKINRQVKAFIMLNTTLMANQPEFFDLPGIILPVIQTTG